MAATELILRLVGGDTEIVCGKLKSLKGFLKSNFELGPNGISYSAHQDSLAYLDANSGALASANQLPEPRARPQTRLLD